MSAIEEFIQLSHYFLEIKNASYQRYFVKNYNFTQRLSLLIGQRGIGKTTTLIQYLLSQVNQDRFSSAILYVQADHFLMGNNSLYEIAEAFYLRGGKLLAIDEVHKYSNWSQELKSIYDTFPHLKVIASGSSALEIHKGSHDLSRRAIIYHMFGLSFREYLELYYELVLPHYSLQEIISNQQPITATILQHIARTNKKILTHFLDYLSHGYYPYFREVNNVTVYYLLLEQSLHTTIEADLVAIHPQLTGHSVKKIKQLLAFIARTVPFTPNWQKLKTILDVGDVRTLKTYVKYLEDAGLILGVTKATTKLKQLELPEKIYLNNPNQMHALSYDHLNMGTVRETFFLNMLSTQYDVHIPTQGDFLIEKKYTFEIGGKKKNFEQLLQLENAYLACDDIEHGINRRIPLWLFGFLY